MTLSILVADDSLASRLAIEEALQDEGYDLRLAVDGSEAEKALLTNPDLVVADICMPGRSGYEIAALAKTERSNVPVILVVGTFEPYDNSAFERSGADWCMKKPFDPVALRAKVDELLADSKGSGETDNLVVEDGESEETTRGTVEEEIAEPETDDLVVEDDGSEETTRGTVEEEIAEPETDDLVGEDDGSEETTRGAGEEEIVEPEAGEDLGVAAEESDSGSGTPEALGSETLGIESLIGESPAFPEPPAEASVSARAAAAVPPEAGPVEASAEEPSGLSPEDIDRIARRVVEIVGDGVLREIAWEVVPDLAEVIVRERLDKLESELEESS